jgi:hypothetical protein
MSSSSSSSLLLLLFLPSIVFLFFALVFEHPLGDSEEIELATSPRDGVDRLLFVVLSSAFSKPRRKEHARRTGRRRRRTRVLLPQQKNVVEDAFLSAFAFRKERRRPVSSPHFFEE